MNFWESDVSDCTVLKPHSEWEWRFQGQVYRVSVSSLKEASGPWFWLGLSLRPVLVAPQNPGFKVRVVVLGLPLVGAGLTQREWKRRKKWEPMPMARARCILRWLLWGNSLLGCFDYTDSLTYFLKVFLSWLCSNQGKEMRASSVSSQWLSVLFLW